MSTLIWLAEYWESFDLFTNEVKMDGTEMNKYFWGDV